MFLRLGVKSGSLYTVSLLLLFGFVHIWISFILANVDVGFRKSAAIFEILFMPLFLRLNNLDLLYIVTRWLCFSFHLYDFVFAVFWQAGFWSLSCFKSTGLIKLTQWFLKYVYLIKIPLQ